MADARKQLEKYFQNYTVWEQGSKISTPSSTRPTSPDMKELADKWGMTLGQTGMVDYFEVQDTELGKTTMLSRTSFSFVGFADLVFNDPPPLYQPRKSLTAAIPTWSLFIGESVRRMR